MKTIKILMILICSSLYLQAQQTLTLSDAIQKALENNYDIRIVDNKQQMAEIQNSWGAAGRYPYIDLAVSNNNSYTIPEDDHYMNNRFSAGASVNWTLFDGFSVRINKQRFEELEELSKSNTAIMVEGTIQSVILAYYDVLLQKELLNTYEEIMTLSEDRYKQAQVKKDLGAIVTYDVLQAQNAYLSDRSAYLLQSVSYKNALRDLNYLLAEKNEITYELTNKFEAIPVDYSLADLQSKMFENNNTLQNQYINQQLLQTALATARSNYSPTLNFNGGLTGNNNRIQYEGKDASWAKSANFYGNFTLSFNLFSGGNRRRAVQIAKIDEEIGLVRLEDIKHDLGNSLANVYEFYEVRKELLNIADENMEAARLNLQISQEKFDTGAINSFNFRDVQNVYLLASQQKLKAIYNLIDAQTSLLRMVGVIVQEFE